MACCSPLPIDYFVLSFSRGNMFLNNLSVRVPPALEKSHSLQYLFIYILWSRNKGEWCGIGNREVR